MKKILLAIMLGTNAMHNDEILWWGPHGNYVDIRDADNGFEPYQMWQSMMEYVKQAPEEAKPTLEALSQGLAPYMQQDTLTEEEAHTIATNVLNASGHVTQPQVQNMINYALSGLNNGTTPAQVQTMITAALGNISGGMTQAQVQIMINNALAGQTQTPSINIQAAQNELTKFASARNINKIVEAVRDLKTQASSQELKDALENLAYVWEQGDTRKGDEINTTDITLADNVDEVKNKILAIKTSMINADFAPNQTTPYDYLIGYASGGAYRKGLFERAIFALEQVTLQSAPYLTDDISYSWNQTELTTWIDDDSTITATEDEYKNFLSLYAMYKSSPIEEVRSGADIMFGHYQELMNYCDQTDFSSNTYLQNAAKEAANALADSIGQSFNQILDVYSTVPTFMLPNSIRRLLAGTATLDLQQSPVSVLKSAQELRELFLQLSVATADTRWANDEGIFTERAGDYQSLSSALAKVARAIK